MMKESELLQYVHKTTQMGRDGIQAVLKYAKDEGFQRALEDQKTEYEKLHSASARMLLERGEDPKGINPMAKASAQMMTAVQAANCEFISEAVLRFMPFDAAFGINIDTARAGDGEHVEIFRVAIY